MKQAAFYHLFLELLQVTFDAENQILLYLEKILQIAFHPDLKEAFAQHREETTQQIQRLRLIFKILDETPEGKTCITMQSLLAENEAFLPKNESSAVKDACLIIGCQKVQHYEIACYGSLKALNRHFEILGIEERINFDEIGDLIEQSLDEKSAADEKLTEIAEGGFFSRGINDIAEEEMTQPSGWNSLSSDPDR
jgi:ferritin-like metal-binding protein YciE